MPQLTLPTTEARIVYLATVYHLGRPGSETDAATLQPHGLGLGAVRPALEAHIESIAREPHAGQAAVEADLSAYQFDRLGEALLGLINELKQYDLTRGRSAVPGFDEAVRRAFPEVHATTTGDGGSGGGEALDLVTHVMALHRRLAPAIGEAREDVRQARETQAEAERAAGRRWWQLWKRRS